jgi:hypothetical protein
MIYAAPDAIASAWFKRCPDCRTVPGRRGKPSPRLCPTHFKRVLKANRWLAAWTHSVCPECADTWEDFFGDACQHCCPHSSGFDHGICVDCEFDRN